MPQSSTVLVADSLDDRRRTLGLALYEGGYEVINAVNGEEALRFTTGLDPTLVIAHTGLEGLEPLDLHERVAVTGLEVPPFLILCDELPEPTDDQPEGAFYYLVSANLEPARFLQQVRLLLLEREIGGQLSDDIDVLYGDLTVIPIGDLLRVLNNFLITGHVSFSVGPEAGFWTRDGEVVDAHWGKVTGRKAFNRLAGLRRGGFVLSLEEPPADREINEELATLVSDAVEEKIQLEELYQRVPLLSSRPEVKMGGDFFAMEFSAEERGLLTQVQKAKNFADLIDRVELSDLEVLRIVERLRDQGFIVFHEPEHRIHVVTDSTADLLPSLARRLNITVVPLSILFGKKVFKDGIDLQPDEFYSMLRTSEVFPTTSPPGKGEFIEAYRRLIPTGDIISIHISSKQSLTGQHAAEAAVDGADEFRKLREEAGAPGEPVIRVVDSRSNSVGLGMLALFAQRMAHRGVGFDDIASRLEDLRERLEFVFLVDTLEYLRKGGRIGGARALIGSLLGVKPILGMKDGEVVSVDKVRGGRKAHPRLIEIFKKRIDPGKPVFAAVGHASAPKWAGRLRDLLQESFSVIELFEGEIGPVVGSHAGPGTVGVILLQPSEDELELLKGE